MAKKKGKVAVAISGGVDSSVAAFLLIKQGYEVVGLHMRLGVDGNAEEAARKVCQQLKIKFYPVNLSRQFKKNVVDYFLDSYQAGITPNPCVNCNRMIKFGELLDRAKEIGAEFLATGHYVKKSKIKNQKSKIIYKIFKPKDKIKDQTYFLYNLNQGILKNILFPLGDYTKDEIKKIAEKNKLPNIKSESQDICFMSSGNAQGKAVEHNEFLKDNLKMKKGKIVLLPPLPNPPLRKGRGDAKEVEKQPHPSPLLRKERGNEVEEVVGEHQGLPLYTIGQRRGVELGGDGPYYVVGMDYKTNILYVSKDHDDPRLFSDILIAKNFNWVAGVEPKLPFTCDAVIRYRHKAMKCKVIKCKVESADEYLIQLDKPQRAVTAGQSVVLYRGDEVLGGGIIN
jgi:tRNA-specific 2-thiouridylase